VIQNGDFEYQPNFGSGFQNDSGHSAFTGTQIPGWIIESGYAVTVHNKNLYPYISGNYSLNLDGEGYNGKNANIYQDFMSFGGLAYGIEYDYMGWISSSAKFTVSVTDLATSLEVFSKTSNWTSSLVHVTDSFIGTGNVLRLRVSQEITGFNDNAFIFDNLSLSPASEVPEPSMMLVGSLLGLGGLLAKRRIEN
jgi:hypothetical protein